MMSSTTTDRRAYDSLRCLARRGELHIGRAVYDRARIGWSCVVSTPGGQIVVLGQFDYGNSPKKENLRKPPGLKISAAVWIFLLQFQQPSFTAAQPKGIDVGVSSVRSGPHFGIESTDRFMNVTGFAQPIHVMCDNIGPKHQAIGESVDVDRRSTWKLQGYQNPFLNFWQFILYLTERLNFCVRRLKLHMKLFSLRIRFFKSDLQTRYLRFKLRRRLALLQRLRLARESHNLTFNSTQVDRIGAYNSDKVLNPGAEEDHGTCKNSDNPRT